MSTEYWSNAVFGYYIDSDEFDKLLTFFPEVTKMRERFDPETGKSLGMHPKVTQVRHHSLVINGEEIDAASGFHEAMESYLHAETNKKVGFWVNQSQLGDVTGYVIGVCLDETTYDVAVKRMKQVLNNFKKVKAAIEKIKPGVIKWDGKTAQIHSMLSSG